MSAMIKVYNITSSYTLGLLYSSFSGLILLIIIGLCIFIHISVNFYRLFYKQNSKQSKTGYILVMLYCVSTMITAFIFGFAVSNLLSRADPNLYATNHCATSRAALNIFIGISHTILYTIFIWRIQKSFEGSCYAFKSLVYKILYVFMVIYCVFYITMQILIAGMESSSSIYVLRKISGTDIMLRLFMFPLLDAL